jgi:hypothetical protein
VFFGKQFRINDFLTSGSSDGGARAASRPCCLLTTQPGHRAGSKGRGLSPHPGSAGTMRLWALSSASTRVLTVGEVANDRHAGLSWRFISAAPIAALMGSKRPGAIDRTQGAAAERRAAKGGYFLLREECPQGRGK